MHPTDSDLPDITPTNRGQTPNARLADATDLPEALSGLPAVTGVELARTAIRTREAAITLSAWRMTVRTAQGDGTITLVDGANSATFRRGDGLFLGWGQPRLAAAYAHLLPGGGRREPDPGQFG
jgi:hypothetical protein